MTDTPELKKLRKPERNLKESQELLAQQIELFTSKIPSNTALDISLSKSPHKYILRYGDVHPLIVEWARLRKLTDLLGKTLKARFGGGGGNPALRAWKSGRIDILSYKYVTHSVNYYQDLFNVIQSGWEYIEYFFQEKDIQNYPKDERSYFLECLREDFDNRLIRCAEGQKNLIQQKEKEMKKIRNLLRDSSSGQNWIDDTQFLDVPQWYTFERYLWISIALMVLDTRSYEDEVLRSMLDTWKLRTSDFAKELASDLERERKNPTKRIKSTKWEKTLLYYGASGGWNLVT